MFYAYNRPRYQVSVYRTLGPLVLLFYLFICLLFILFFYFFLVGGGGQKYMYMDLFAGCYSKTHGKYTHILHI